MAVPGVSSTNRLACLVVSLVILAAVSGGCDRSGTEGRRASGSTTASGDSTNLLLITLDTTRADRIGCYGHEAARTPRLDALAASGARFEHAYCQVPLTMPSHASLLTGTYPIANGVRVNGQRLDAGATPTLASHFKSKGYRTGAFVSAFVLHHRFGLDDGFDLYEDSVGASGGDTDEHDIERSGEHTCDVALDWLQSQPGSPFFAWVHFFDPHHPYEPPPPFRDELADAYDGEIAFVDAQVGRLIDWLEAAGLRENTLVVVAGDHGESLGAHEELQHGLFLYDDTIRVPLIMSWPGKLPGDRVVEGGVQLVDSAPTILDLLGHVPAFDMDGTSFARAWRTGDWPFAPCYAESEYAKLSFGWAPLRSMRTERWLYVEAPKAELYDYRADPACTENVIAGFTGDADTLRGQLNEWRSRMKPRRDGMAEVDASAVRALESLGYISGPAVSDGVDDLDRHDPKDMVDVLNAVMQAVHLQGLERYADVVALLEPVRERSPESDSIHRTLGQAYLELKRYAEAEEAFAASLRQNPNDTARLSGLGESLFYLRKFDEAVSVFEAALKIDDALAQVHSRLGNIYGSRGSIKRAERHFVRFVELSPESPNAHFNLGGLRMSQGRFSEAANLFRRAIEIDPACHQAHRGLWDAMRRSGVSRSVVREILESSHDRKPDDAMLAARLAWALATSPTITQDEIIRSLKLSAQAVEALARDAYVQDVRAACLAAAGDFSAAVETARLAHTLAQQQRRARLTQQIETHLRRYEASTRYQE